MKIPNLITLLNNVKASFGRYNILKKNSFFLHFWRMPTPTSQIQVKGEPESGAKMGEVQPKQI
jgi:hypothetical protein